MRRASALALLLYVAVSIAAIVSLTLVKIDADRSLIKVLEQGPGTNPSALLLSVAFLWIMVGGSLLLIVSRQLSSATVLFWILGVSLSLLYLEMLREMTFFSDYHYFIAAAMNILAEEPFHEFYVYPPLWASILAKIYGLFGRTAAVVACFAVSHASIGLFYGLGSLFLVRCNLSLNLASLLVFASLFANAVVLRNVVYVQMNFAMLDLLLASILLFPVSKLASAALLGLGSHLKVVPVLFAPFFLASRKWRWLVYFLLAVLGLALLTIVNDGATYYRGSLENIGKWRLVALRSCSIYGFLVNSKQHLGLDFSVALVWNWIRVPLALGVVTLAFISIRKRCFARLDDRDLERIINGAVPLFFLILVMAPTIWPHHLVLLIVPTLLTLLKIESPWQLTWYSTGYALTFLLPVFDGYPWSYLRLAGWLILLGVMASTVLHSPFRAGWVEESDRSLGRFVEEGWLIFHR